MVVIQLLDVTKTNGDKADKITGVKADRIIGEDMVSRDMEDKANGDREDKANGDREDKAMGEDLILAKEALGYLAAHIKNETNWLLNRFKLYELK